VLKKSKVKTIAKEANMSKSAKSLPIRQSDDGKWEVENVPNNWIRCENESDAKILSNAPVIEASWLETRPHDKALAARLEHTAEKMEQYNMRADARRLRKWAKLARGERS
jgi:hypothetical protein